MMGKFLGFLSYAKKFIAALGNALVVTGSAISDSKVDSQEWALIVAAWTAAFAVYQLANAPRIEE